MKYELNDTAEDFTLRNTNGEERSLYEALENQKIMLVFFRGFW